MKKNAIEYEFVSSLLDEPCTEHCCTRLLTDEAAIEAWHCYHAVHDGLQVLALKRRVVMEKSQVDEQENSDY